MPGQAQPNGGMPIATPSVTGVTSVKSHIRTFRDSVVSALCFLLVVAVLVGIDSRVRDHVADLVSNAPEEWPDRVNQLASALIAAARDQSLEHAPLVVFAGIGALLLLAMLRS